MSMINIDDLNSKMKKKQDDKNKIYDTILKKCHYRIKKTADVDNVKFCFFNIPRYVFGSPLYNFDDCLLYLAKMLSYNGFDVRYTHPNLLFISWSGKSNPKDYKSMDRISNGYRSIEDYKQSKGLIYNKKTLESLGNKINLLK
tara:strand:+ start:164 stop:592 length:429 start_codon:yes stop_codon:yes gene_type:complete